MVVASPLGDLSWWPVGRHVAEPVAVVEVDVADGRPYGATWLAKAAQALHAARPAGPLLLIGHGVAGPLLPAVARTQRPAHRRVAGYVFVDATLPRPGRPSHLDLLRAADPAKADDAHRRLHADSVLWPPQAPRGGDHEFWTTPLPPAIDWPDAPCTYVRTGVESPGTGDTRFWARSARARRWMVHDGADVDAVVTKVLHTG